MCAEGNAKQRGYFGSELTGKFDFRLEATVSADLHTFPICIRSRLQPASVLGLLRLAGWLVAREWERKDGLPGFGEVVVERTEATPCQHLSAFFFFTHIVSIHVYDHFLSLFLDLPISHLLLLLLYLLFLLPHLLLLFLHIFLLPHPSPTPSSLPSTLSPPLIPHSKPTPLLPHPPHILPSVPPPQHRLLVFLPLLLLLLSLWWRP